LVERYSREKQLPSCSLDSQRLSELRKVFLERTSQMLSARTPIGDGLTSYSDFHDWESDRDQARQMEVEHELTLRRLSAPIITYLLRHEDPGSIEIWETRSSEEPDGEVLALQIAMATPDGLPRIARLTLGDWTGTVSTVGMLSVCKSVLGRV